MEFKENRNKGMDCRATLAITFVAVRHCDESLMCQHIYS